MALVFTWRGQTANRSYLRFHGRNYNIWNREEKEDDYRLDRYDYLYKKDQLEPWLPQIKEAERKTTKVGITSTTTPGRSLSETPFC